MKKQDVRAEIHCLIVEILNIDPFIADENDNLKDDIGLDSLDLLELVIEIEKKYNILIPDEYYKIETFGGFVDYVHNIIIS